MSQLSDKEQITTRPLTGVVIPAHNEEKSIAKVIAAIPEEYRGNVVVVENACSDRTAEQARAAGAIVVSEPRPGYGRACLRGIAEHREKGPPEVLVFLDGDFSDFPGEMPHLVRPILEDRADMVIGSRALGKRESGSMTIPQVFGNRLATTLLRMLYGAKFTDLGPFRAIRWESLEALHMQDETYGWTVEMQAKAARAGLRSIEVPVDYRRRIGKSKISGTVKGTVLAGYKIITTIFRCAR